MKLELCQPVQVVAAAEGEAPSRTIMGLAVPWNVTAYASTGPVRFLPGSIPTDGKAPKLIRNHDLADPIGIVTERPMRNEWRSLPMAPLIVPVSQGPMK